MSVQIKSLTNGAPAKDISLIAAADSFNVIPTANDIYDLYTAPNTATTKRGAIVKGIRLINTAAGSTKAKITLYFNRPTTGGQSRRRLLAPADIELAAGYCFIDDGDITLEPGDKIQARADTANVIHYVISGVERDMT